MTTNEKSSTNSGESEVITSHDFKMHPSYMYYSYGHQHIQGPQEMMELSYMPGNCYSFCCYGYPESFVWQDILQKADESEQNELYTVHLEYLEKRTTHEANIKLAESEMYGEIVKILKKKKTPKTK